MLLHQTHEIVCGRWAVTHGGLRVWWLWCAQAEGLFSAVCGRDAPNAEPRQNLWNKSTDALGTFPFVKLIYMLDLKLIILMTNPALVLGSVWFFWKLVKLLVISSLNLVTWMCMQRFDTCFVKAAQKLLRVLFRGQFSLTPIWFFGLKIGLTIYFFIRFCGLLSFKKH